MIIVLGRVTVREDKLEQAIALSREHVERSRLEPGCLEHGVSQDAEAQNRLVFVEQWASMDALQAHFAVPESRGFVRAIAGLAVSAPSMEIIEGREVQISD